MNFSYYIAKRYLFTKNSNNAINIITLIASFGVIIGALALFIILSGFSGLRTFSYSLLAISDPDIKISAVKGKTFLFTDSLQNKLTGNTKIAVFSKVIEQRVFLTYNEKPYIAYIKGVDEHYNHVTKIDSAIVVGSWLDPKYVKTAVLGNGISFKLSLGVMNFTEPLEIYVPKPGNKIIHPSNSFNKITAQVTGIYSGTEEFENKYVFVNLPLAQQLLKYKDNQIAAIEIKLTDPKNADSFAADFQKQIGNSFKVETKAQLNALFYKVINTENFVSYLIFTLIVIIALFNVVGVIIMMIIDKQKNLKTLFYMGASLKDIQKIFVFQGSLLTLTGTFIGLFLGVLLVFIQQRCGLFIIAEHIPYPVELRVNNFVIVAATIIVLGYLAAKIASSRISKSFIER
ncbi:MAG: FtsX-like permease family protein [Flavobacteriaceae bacterium]|nr:MAG: FtsX-like permease family protein [Flavobacteriaceae bacterium]